MENNIFDETKPVTNTPKKEAIFTDEEKSALKAVAITMLIVMFIGTSIKSIISMVYVQGVLGYEYGDVYELDGTESVDTSILKSEIYYEVIDTLKHDVYGLQYVKLQLTPISKRIFSITLFGDGDTNAYQDLKRALERKYGEQSRYSYGGECRWNTGGHKVELDVKDTYAYIRPRVATTIYTSPPQRRVRGQRTLIFSGVTVEYTSNRHLDKCRKETQKLIEEERGSRPLNDML